MHYELKGYDVIVVSMFACLFILLKATGHIDLTWLFVLMPIWLGVVVHLFLSLCQLIFGRNRNRDS